MSALDPSAPEVMPPRDHSAPAAPAAGGLTIVDGDHPACIHHWMLGEPVAGLIAAHCRKCGARRAYGATPDSTGRFDDYRELTASSTYHQGGPARRSA